MSFQRFAHLREPVSVAANAVAILPLAAVETHGPHLPLGTDGIIAEGIIDRAAQRGSAVAIRMPLLWLGASAEHAHRPGTLSREPEALIADIVALAAGLDRAGIKRVILFNGHGGNVAAGAMAALKLRTSFGMLAASAHWLDFGLPKSVNAPKPAKDDVHGGWIETSVLLHLTPDLVRREAAKDRSPRVPAPLLAPSGPINWGWTSDDLGGGSIGFPEQADAAIGEKLVDHAADGLHRLIGELAAAPWPLT